LDILIPNDAHTVNLSTATPRDGAYSWNDTGLVILKDRYARETRAPQLARILSSFCLWPLWCGASRPQGANEGLSLGANESDERVEGSPEAGATSR